MGISLLCTGEVARRRMHFDRAVALYDPPRTVRLRYDLVKITEWQSCLIGRWLYGCLAIPTPRLKIRTKHLVMRVRSAKLPL